MARGDGFSIIKRKRGGRELERYQVRVQVPVELRAAVGQTEVLRSLGTADRRIAAQLAPKIVSDLQSEWRRKACVPALSSPQRRVPNLAELEEAAVILGYELPGEDADTARKTLRGKGGPMYRAHVNLVRAELEDQVIAAATGDHNAVRELADLAIDALGFDLPRDSERYGHFCELLNTARLADLRQQTRRNAGDVESGPGSELVQRVRERDAAKAKPGETILELFELWAAEKLAKDEKRLDTVNQDRKVIKQFAAFVGIDRDVRSVTPMDVAEYRDTLRKLPPKWMSNKKLRDLDMRSAAVKARELGMAQTTFNNINRYLSTISPLYKWLAAQPKWAGLSNPCAGLNYDKAKGKNPRPPFGTADLNKILGSPLFTGFLADGQEGKPGKVQADDWRKWVPLACMFTGARLGEIAQLRVGDVRKERGVWFIHIREDEQSGQKTKSRKSRFAAVHPGLEEIGFLTFHQRQSEHRDDDAPLFPELAPNSRGQISGGVSRWWRDYLEAIGVKDASKQGGDGFGSHSFRHTLADRLRDEAELLDNEVAVCLGHSTRTTTSGYGRLSQGTVTKFKGWMDAVTFDGVDFGPLTAASRKIGHSAKTSENAP